MCVEHNFEIQVQFENFCSEHSKFDRTTSGVSLPQSMGQDTQMWTELFQM